MASKSQYLLTPEQHKYLVRYQAGRHRFKLTELINRKFGLNLTVKQVFSYCKNHKLKCGFHGNEGIPSPQKGIKKPGFVNAGSFKNGHVPAGKLPIGAEAVTADGYIRVKVGEPDKWEFKHRIIWEKYNGPIPKGYKVIFCDSNRQNCDIDNLEMITNSEFSYMQHYGLIGQGKAVARTGSIMAKISSAAKQAKQAKKAKKAKKARKDN